MELGSRRIVHANVTSSPTLAWVKNQVREIAAWGDGPRFLIHDNDGIFGQLGGGRRRRKGGFRCHLDPKWGLTGADHAVSYPGRRSLVSVAKLSITVEESDLEWVRREAKRSKQSVSAVVADAIAQKRAVRAQRQYLKAAGPLDEAELRRAMQELG
jgi:hypothetical protein